MFPNASNLICAASEARQEAVRLQKENKDLLVELQMLKTRFKGKDPMLDNEVRNSRFFIEIHFKHLMIIGRGLQGWERETENEENCRATNRAHC